MEMIAETYGVAPGVKVSDLREEDFFSFSNAPFDFEDTALNLWDDTQKVYYHACTANRFSDDYLTHCKQLEKNIKQLGSFCLTKAALEQKGIGLSKLKEMTVEELVRMVSFHYRKAHAALDGIYKDNHVLGITYLNWEFRWVGLGNRLKATEVKIQKIKEGTLNVDSILEQNETFKGKERSNTGSVEQATRSLRAAPNALPIKGSMAREMLAAEKAAQKEAEAIQKEKERLLKLAERYESKISHIPGGIQPARPFGPSKEDWDMINRANADYYRKQAEALTSPMPEPEPEVDSLPEGTLTEEQAREQLLEDAKRRNDHEAIRAIPTEDIDTLHKRWQKYAARVEREAIRSRSGPSNSTRKILREKRKKKK